jgi:hypothetical protein
MNKVKLKFEWEKIGEWEFRAKVIGGWILKVIDCDRPTLTFVADPFHAWEIEK